MKKPKASIYCQCCTVNELDGGRCFHCDVPCKRDISKCIACQKREERERAAK